MEGLWSIAFSTQFAANYGVVYFTSSGHFVGGDSVFYWTGMATTREGQLIANFKAHTHSGRPAVTVLNTTVVEFSMELSGEAPKSSDIGSTFKIAGPSGFAAVLTKRA
jgi:hypothetical protein